jgi:hypothetical protein
MRALLPEQVVAAGLPAVNIAYVNAEGEPPTEAWPALVRAFSIFLLGSPSAEAAAASSVAAILPAEDVRCPALQPDVHACDLTCNCLLLPLAPKPGGQPLRCRT